MTLESKMKRLASKKRKPLRINGEKHDEMLLPITPSFASISANMAHLYFLQVQYHDEGKHK
jgi:hypothetical protein